MPEKAHYCPLDGRKFATKAALRQHRSSVHSNATMYRKVGSTKPRRGKVVKGNSMGTVSTVATSAPVAKGYATSSRAPTELRLRYREYWTGLSGLNQRLTYLTFNPGSSQIPRLDTFGGLFDMYRVNSAKIEYLPLVGTNTDGAIIFGVDYDAADKPTSYAQVATMQPNLRTAIWQRQTMTIPQDLMRKSRWLQTNNDSADEDGAKTAFALAVASNGMTSGDTIGELWIEYDVTFAGPTLSPVSQNYTVEATPKLDASNMDYRPHNIDRIYANTASNFVTVGSGSDKSVVLRCGLPGIYHLTANKLSDKMTPTLFDTQVKATASAMSNIGGVTTKLQNFDETLSFRSMLVRIGTEAVNKGISLGYWPAADALISWVLRPQYGSRVVHYSDSF